MLPTLKAPGLVTLRPVDPPHVSGNRELKGVGGRAGPRVITEGIIELADDDQAQWVPQLLRSMKI